MPATVLVRMAIFYVVRQWDIVHAANRALARLIAAAAFVVHGAYIGRSVFLVRAMRLTFGGFRLGAIMWVYMLVAVFFTTTTCGHDEDEDE
jgi:hypothetical protein